VDLGLADRSYPVRSAVLAAYPGRVNDVAFGPDDRSFSAAGPGKTIRTWIADVDDVTAALCSNPASVITPEEWEQYFRVRHYPHPALISRRSLPGAKPYGTCLR